MLGIVGISGKIGSFVADLFASEYDIVGYDIYKSNKYTTYNNFDDFFSNDIDIVIDFSNSELSKDILIECIKRNIKVLSGTSNIINLNEICNLAKEKKVGFVYLENYSKGINNLISLLDNIQYDSVELIEEHYYTKKDISQTAVSIAKYIGINNISSIRTLKKESNHYIKFYLENEEIEVIHKCFNPKAYKEIIIDEFNKLKNSDFYFKCGII